MFDDSMLSLSLLSFFLCPVHPSLHVYLFLSHTLSLCPSCSLSLSKNFPLYMYYLSQKKINVIKIASSCPGSDGTSEKFVLLLNISWLFLFQFCFLSQGPRAFKQDLYLPLFSLILFFFCPSLCFGESFAFSLCITDLISAISTLKTF